MPHEYDVMGRPIAPDEGRELDWEDEVSSEGAFTVLPAGDYDFEVTAMERARYSPREGAKLPPCNMAVLTLNVGGDQRAARITHRLYLHSSQQWKLHAFFIAIGQGKPDEPLKMHWGQVVGAKGRCKVSVRQYTTDKGEVRLTNQIDKFYELPQAAGGWAPGKF